MKIKNTLFFGIIMVSAMVFSSCSKEDTPAATAKTMVVHASPDAPAVDVLIDNSTVVNNVAFPSFTTSYLSVNTGTRRVRVNAAGTTTSIIDVSLPFDANKNYTIFAVDSLSKITPIRLEDDLTAPASGKAHVRFVHLSPNAPAVDIAVTGGAVISGLSNTAFKASTSFVPLDAGTFNLDVRVAGTSTVALAVPNVTLQSGKIYTIFARGFNGATGSQALGASIITHN